VEKIKVSLKWAKIAGTLHEDRFTFLTITRSKILKLKNISDKVCRENRNTHFVFNNFFSPKIVPFFEIMRKKIL